ncbi:hypothetical protein GCM10009730_57320 [Streptomyces albidochromogenes]|uniref:hypothetical protein n=1 Tax=Streptomyces albidochromogenes TaxID=329524 RepID=UPI001FCB3992|nr:hypothetical protein [Streptomyces albidochromogenes]
MRHNSRAAIKASTMRPEHLNLRDTEPHMAVCPDCSTWHRLKRAMITPHRDNVGVPDKKDEPRRYRDDAVSSKPSGGRRCPGSAQRIELDITAEQWAERLLKAESTVAARRTARPIRKPQPVIPATVSRLATVPKQASRLLVLLQSARVAVDEHRADCAAECSRRGRCETARELESCYAEIRATYTLTLEQQDRQEQNNGLSEARQRAAQWREVAPRVRRVDRERASLGR